MYALYSNTQFQPEKRGRGAVGLFRQTLSTMSPNTYFSLSGLNEKQAKSKAVALSSIGKDLGVKFSTKTLEKREDGTVTIRFTRVS